MDTGKHIVTGRKPAFVLVVLFCVWFFWVVCFVGFFVGFVWGFFWLVFLGFVVLLGFFCWFF